MGAILAASACAAVEEAAREGQVGTSIAAGVVLAVVSAIQPP